MFLKCYLNVLFYRRSDSTSSEEESQLTENTYDIFVKLKF